MNRDRSGRDGDDRGGSGRRCPGCGRTGTLQKRYSTGGGWRVVGYQCRACGRRVDREGA